MVSEGSATLRLLLLDDEAIVRRSVERLLRNAEPAWEVVPVGTADDAVSALEATPFDIIVSDLNLGPGSMTGAELLAFSQERHPDAVRIVLSGQTGTDLSARTVPTAHLVLPKPFDPLELRDQLKRAAELRLLLSDLKLRSLVGSSNRLPSPPRLFREMTRLLSSRRSAIEDIASLIEQDVALSAQLMRLVASAFFGLPQKVRTVRGAVAYLGFNTVKTLVLGVAIAQEYKTPRPVRGFDIDALQRHSLLTARLAREILAGSGLADDAFSAGMLHNVGQLLLASRAPEEYSEVMIRAREGQDLCASERATFGVTHPEVGAYLLGIWGLPQPLVRAVARHHLPDAAVSEDLDPALAVALAQKLTSNPDAPAMDGASDPASAIDLRHLREVGVVGRLESWRDSARAHQKGETG